MATSPILGSGSAGLSLASLLGSDSVVLEKEPTFGGLCRGFGFNGIAQFSRNRA
jgi:protoporphyrinogen oxidase